MSNQQPFNFQRSRRTQFRSSNREPVFQDVSDGISREETRNIIDDKLEAVEARTDVKLVDIAGKLDLMFSEMRHQSSAVSDVTSDLKTFRSAVKDEYQSTRTTIIVTAIGSVLAILGLMYTSQSNLLSAFQTGLTALTTVATTPVTPPKAGTPVSKSPLGAGSNTQP